MTASLRAASLTAASFSAASLGAASLAAALAGGPAPAAADVNYSPSNWNGHHVYLSPARHSSAGSRGECNNNNENHMAHASAVEAAVGLGHGLVDRGYKVQIGTGTVSSAIANSNAWDAHAHIPIHSNAAVDFDCADTDPSRHGTVVIYANGSSSGQRLAGILEAAIDGYSPGTRDYTCMNPGDPCTSFNRLGELHSTNAPSAYLEAEFHTWKTGTDWLTDNNWQWLMGYTVDQFYGYPR